MSDLMNHPVFTCVNELATICRPLEKLKIDGFGHARIFTNKEIACMNNIPKFHEVYIQKKFYNADLHMAKKDFGPFIVWDAIDCSGEANILNQEAALLGVQHTFTIIEKNLEWTDYYHFSNSSNSKSINQVYLSNIDLLKLFIKYFNNQVKDSNELTKAYELRYKLENIANFDFYVEDMVLPGRTKKQFISELTVNNLESVSKKLSPNMHSLVFPQKESNNVNPKRPSLTIEKFSKREVECIYLTVRGRSAKQISNELRISRRTVEEYLANIKTKMGVFSRSDLIDNAISLFE